MSVLEQARKAYARRKAQGNGQAKPACRTSQTCAESAISAESPLDCWDQARADAVLSAVHARCDRALVAGEANSQARRNVVEVCRAVAVLHHRDRYPLLWNEPESLEELIARWWNAGGPPPEDWWGEG
jgi:hypothetical protein